MRRFMRRRDPSPVRSRWCLTVRKGRSSSVAICAFGDWRGSRSSNEKRRVGKTFTWENVDYTVPVPGGTLRLLNDVHGFVKPGTMTALMGSSGAGKTTCLDVLAQRKNIGVVSGDYLVDGRPLGSDFARGTAYGLC